MTDVRSDVLGDLDATALAERIRLRDVTAQEALEAAMARAEKLNPKLNSSPRKPMTTPAPARPSR